MVVANTLEKDKRRTTAFNQKWLHDECWRTSLKYSSQLIKNSKSTDLNNLCHSIYGQYMNELQSRRLPMKNKNYIQIWSTMLNSVKRGNHTQMAIKLLHQTNIQRSS
jgi:hypothetical protein